MLTPLPCGDRTISKVELLQQTDSKEVLTREISVFKFNKWLPIEIIFIDSAAAKSHTPF